MTSASLGLWAALGAAACWASAAVLFKQTTESVSPLGLTLVKGLVALVPFGILVALNPVSLPLQSVAVLALSGVIGIAVGDTLFFASLGALPAHLVVVLVVLGQSLTVAGGVVLFGDDPSAGQWAGMALILAGLFAALQEPPAGQPWGRGLLFGLGAVLAMTVGTLVAKAGLHEVPALPATFVRLAAGTAGVALLGLARGQIGEWLRPIRAPAVLRPLAGAIALGTFAGFWLFHLALELADVSLANSVAAVEPLLAIPLAALVLKETVSPRALAGGVLGVVGVVLVMIG